MIYKKAFSLIELSIVILIIGIIISGVTQGSRLVSLMKIQSARNLTQSSPVNSIQGLTAWWELTLEKSISENEASNGSNVTTWYDNSVVNTAKIDLTQNDVNLKPIYNINIFNGLPGLKFDGVDKFILNNIVAETFSMFVVLKTPNTGGGNISTPAYSGMFAVGADIGGLGRDIIPLSFAGGYPKFFTGNGSWESTLTSPVYVADNNPRIIFISRDMPRGIRTLMVNNANMVTDNDGSNGIILNSVSTMAIGGDFNFVPGFNGHFAEIIIYNKILNTEERTAISQYLAQKYGIKL